jgi:hypothetical protein
MTTTPKTPLSKRIKHRTPEILVGASIVAGVVSLIYIRKTLNATPTLSAVFGAHAADASVEIIAGGEEAFAVLSKAAAEILDKTGSVTLADWDEGTYVLNLITK